MTDVFETRIREAVADIADIPDAEWQRVRRLARVMDLARGEHLWEIGSRVDNTYFIDSGLLRVYYLRDDREINRSFVLGGRFYTNSLAFNTGEPSNSAVQALEDTRLVAIDRQVAEAMYTECPAWERFGRVSANRALVLRERREERFRGMTAEEHYRWLVESDSPFIGRIPLYHLASYLGIAPETLSRIRARAPTSTIA